MSLAVRTTATVRADGQVVPWIVGPRLDGSGGTAAVADSDGGRWDRDPVWDRAVGPMQFIPTSWQRFGRDGNGDGTADPHNVYDAAAAATRHLCHAPPSRTGGAKDLTDRGELRLALFAYNRSTAYVTHVLEWVDTYTTATAAPPTRGGYVLPVARELVTAAMLSRRHHDYPAVDVPIPTGTPVMAVHGGRVAAVTAAGSRCGLGVGNDRPRSESGKAVEYGAKLVRVDVWRRTPRCPVRVASLRRGVRR